MVAGDSDGWNMPRCTCSAQPTSKATSMSPFSAEALETGARSVAPPAATRDELGRSSGGETCASAPLLLEARPLGVPPRGRIASALEERTRPLRTWGHSREKAKVEAMGEAMREGDGGGRWGRRWGRRKRRERDGYGWGGGVGR